MRSARWQQTAEQHGIDFSPEPNLAIDFNHGHARVELVAVLGVGVDIDNRRVETVIGQRRQGVVTEVTTCSRVKDYVHHRFRISRK
jgi:hypothetical protein